MLALALATFQVIPPLYRVHTSTHRPRDNLEVFSVYSVCTLYWHGYGLAAADCNTSS